MLVDFMFLYWGGYCVHFLVVFLYQLLHVVMIDVKETQVRRDARLHGTRIILLLYIQMKTCSLNTLQPVAGIISTLIAME